MIAVAVGEFNVSGDRSIVVGEMGIHLRPCLDGRKDSAGRVMRFE